jgi:hypothetical protein
MVFGGCPPPQRERATRSARPCPSSGPPTLLSSGLMPPSPGPRHRRPFDDPLSGPLLRRLSPLRRRAAPPTVYPRLGTGSRGSILSTDLGQRGNPPVENGVALMAERLLLAGFSEAVVRPMAVEKHPPGGGPPSSHPQLRARPEGDCMPGTDPPARPGIGGVRQAVDRRPHREQGVPRWLYQSFPRARRFSSQRRC